MPTAAYDLTYLSLGAGVQSSALLICSALGLHGVPKADVAIFADTQNEPPHVYEAVARLTAWAAPHGIPVEIVTAGNLLEDAKARIAGTRSRFASIPLFSKGNGESGRSAPGRRQCTSEYKIRPIEKYVRSRLGYAAGKRVKKHALNFVGISVDELYRVKPSRTPWITRAHPLVDARLTREACIRIVVEAGLPMPKKSACVFCPYTDNRRWQEMKRDDPESFAAAAAAARRPDRPASSASSRRATRAHTFLRPMPARTASLKSARACAACRRRLVIHFARVPTDDKVTRLIVVGDAMAFLAKYCAASDSLRSSGITAAAFELSPRPTCDIDLGGMAFETAARAQLDVDGDVFEVSLEHVQGIAGAWSVHGKERVPGWWRAPGWHWFYVMPVPTYVRVKAWLDALAEAPETAAEIRRIHEIASEAGVRRPLPPR